MTARMTAPIDHRASLPLTPRDVADLAKLRSLAPVRAKLSLPEGDISESVLLHAVLVAGIESIQAAIQDNGYAELAEQYRDTPEGTERRAARRAPARFNEG